MRRNIKGYIFVLLIALVILFNVFVLNTYRISPWYPAVFWIGLFVLSLILFGRRKRTTSKFVDVIQLVFIYCMGYELLTYLSGLFLGFVRSPYSMTPINIIKNVAPFLIMIIAQEYVRSAVITRFQKEKKVIIAITIGIIAYEISYGIWSYDLKSASDIVKLLSILVAGSVTKNCLCSYMAYRTDYKPAVLYRSIFELLIYFVPIYPNLGEYIEAMVAMVFPVILLVSIIAIYEKKKYREPKKNLLQTIMLWIPTVFVILLVLGLQSGIFKYRSMSIGSQSMYPNISKGDVVIIEQYDSIEELESIVVGEVLVFKHDGIIIVHRVTKIIERDGRLLFKTKGDNNNSEDSYDIDQSLVVGVAKFRIPYIGYPSVWLSETING